MTFLDFEMSALRKQHPWGCKERVSDRHSVRLQMQGECDDNTNMPGYFDIQINTYSYICTYTEIESERKKNILLVLWHVGRYKSSALFIVLLGVI